MRTASDLAEEGTLGLAKPGQLAAVAAQVATHLDAEAAALTHGLAGAVMLAALATRPVGRQLVMQKGHDIEIAGPLSALLALTGAEVVEVGSVDRATSAELEAALADDAAATFFVADERLAARGLIELPQFRWIARQRGVPTIVVAPATRNWEGLLDADADLLVLDAATALDGPAVGIVAGSTRLIEAALAAQACGLGRAFRPMPIALQMLTDALGKPAPMARGNPGPAFAVRSGSGGGATEG